MGLRLWPRRRSLCPLRAGLHASAARQYLPPCAPSATASSATVSRCSAQLRRSTAGSPPAWSWHAVPDDDARATLFCIYSNTVRLGPAQSRVEPEQARGDVRGRRDGVLRCRRARHPDLAHSAREPRALRLGSSTDGRVVVVAYTRRGEDDGETIRIISARRANRRERAAYRAGN